MPSNANYLGCRSLGILLLLSCAPAADAALVVVGEQFAVAQPASSLQIPIGFFVDLTGVDDGGSVQVGNFQLRIGLIGPHAGTSVRFVGVEDNASVAHPQVVPLDFTHVVSSTEVFASTLNVSTDPITVPDQAGLLQVIVELDASVIPGSVYELAVIPGAGNTEFTDPLDFSTLLPFSSFSGELRVIPEPAAWMMLVLLAAVTAVRRVWQM